MPRKKGRILILICILMCDTFDLNERIIPFRSRYCVCLHVFVPFAVVGEIHKSEKNIVIWNINLLYSQKNQFFVPAVRFLSQKQMRVSHRPEEKKGDIKANEREKNHSEPDWPFDWYNFIRAEKIRFNWSVWYCFCIGSHRYFGGLRE